MSKVSERATAVISRAVAGHSDLERGESPEFFKSLVDLFAGQGAKALHTELFATEASHYGAINHRAVQFGCIEITFAKIEASLGQITDEASGETIARAGWVKHVFEQITRDHEEGVFAEQHG